MGQSRSYGWSDTIHRNNSLDVEVDKNGVVVAVWFRCQLLPFVQANVDDERAEEMTNMGEYALPKLLAVDLEDQ